MAEYEEAFERPQYGVHPNRGSGFVRAGGELVYLRNNVADDRDTYTAPNEQTVQSSSGSI